MLWAQQNFWGTK